MTEKAPTHIAHALRKESKQRSRYIEIGHARIEKDGGIHACLSWTVYPSADLTGHANVSIARWRQVTRA